MEVPQRMSLVNQTVTILENMIQSGELIDFLPGERVLAKQLQIGRDTLRSALQQLEQRGIVAMSLQGKKRQIIAKHQIIQRTTSPVNIGFLSPKRLEEMSPNMLIEVDQLREKLAQRRLNLHIKTPKIYHLKNPDTYLKELLAENNYDGWILYQATEAIQLWFAKHQVPSLVRGFSYSNVGLPSIDIDWYAAAQHATYTLLNHGHTSLGLMVPNTNLPGLNATASAMQNVLETNKQKGTFHLIKESRTISGIQKAVQRALKRDNPPTAIVTTRARQVITLLSWLASHGLRIPRDISIISLDYDNLYDAIIPKISYYHREPQYIVNDHIRAIEQMLQGSLHSRKLYSPEYIQGESVRKMPNEQSKND